LKTLDIPRLVGYNISTLSHTNQQEKESKMSEIKEKFYRILDQIIEEKGRVPHDTEQAQRVYDCIGQPCPPEARDSIVMRECDQRIKWLQTPELRDWVMEVKSLAEQASHTDHDIVGYLKNKHSVRS